MTRPYFQSSLKRPLTLVTLLLILFSYQSFAGGDHYEVYLNKKLVAKQFVTNAAATLSLQLDKSNYNDEVIIYYSHCGVTGKGRTVRIKDEKGNLLKEWKFPDTNNTAAMTIPVKEILDLKKNGGNLNLYYSAQELPKGRILTAINLSDKNTAANKQDADSYWSSIGFAFSALMAMLGRI